MRKKILTLLLPGILISFTQPISAENQTGLTADQIRHEQALTELRKQKEILELKHSQAMLIRDCHEMGIDCREADLDIRQDPLNDLATVIGSQEPHLATSLEESSFSIEGIKSKSSVSPTLEAIQNDSAKLKYSGETQWALVGDTVGEWVVTHIDASKVRIKHSGNSNSKTLVLNW
ncbi:MULTISPECIES: hypothetical protein [unclassified Methylophaga]|jgi:hypothetical protein|uniref:hypothetical protein n=1 Tax=unclassified Methylophaga TaxID=2629249 RepID=UPI000C47EB86|nr:MULTISPECIES: hypothetical protein [unclassified Methylophaga]MAL50976.1 hypothetical protein [Methylophaga sp.]MBP24276.1 hypothetical protein [Methylophaga sp.]HCC82307.1 hypothetical protein [Methylophaga sp.]|tara:strand:+ start:17656 stop:18183 length:528 start_codon:yes stop_codon:yes gene_type:complete